MVDYPVGTRFDWKNGNWAVITAYNADGGVQLLEGSAKRAWNTMKVGAPKRWMGLKTATITFPKQHFIQKFNKFVEL